MRKYKLTCPIGVTEINRTLFNWADVVTRVNTFTWRPITSWLLIPTTTLLNMDQQV